MYTVCMFLRAAHCVYSISNSNSWKLTSQYIFQDCNLQQQTGEDTLAANGVIYINLHQHLPQILHTHKKRSPPLSYNLMAV